MRKYIFKRLLYLFPVLFGITFLTLELLSAVPELEGCDFGGKEAAYTGD
ncbi:hypothetical protein ACFHWD_06945 [Clostridium sp. MT-14]